MEPLTHHQILALAAPFSRAGRQVDLAASDRAARRLAFRPVDHAAVPGRHPALTETLQLDAGDVHRFTLTRLLAGTDGLCARLDAQGADPAALLDRVEAVPASRQWRLGEGAEDGVVELPERAGDAAWSLALSHRVAGPPGNTNDGLDLTDAALQLPGWHLRWTPPPVHSRLGELRLTAEAAPGDVGPLPQDLLAVLGHAWTRLLPAGGVWIGQLRQRGNSGAACARTEARLLRTAQHLAATFAAPPADFHRRHAGARWRVTGRRTVPALVSLGLVGGAAAVPQLALASDSVLRMLVQAAPPLLMVAFFSLREVPRIEVPPLPRPLRQARWLPAPAQLAAPGGDTGAAALPAHPA
jgi:hypothetical protein